MTTAPVQAPVALAVAVHLHNHTRTQVVVCPHCGQLHRHGRPYGVDSDQPSHRVAHCQPSRRQFSRGSWQPPAGSNLGYRLPPVPPVGWQLHTEGPTGYQATLLPCYLTEQAAAAARDRLLARLVYRRHRITITAVNLHTPPNGEPTT